MMLNLLLYVGILFLIERIVTPEGYGNIIQYCNRGYWGDGHFARSGIWFLGLGSIWSWLFFRFIFGV